MTRPNILIFFTDDQRFDTIRALGNDQIHTPNMDYLVRNGTTFENAYIMGGTNEAICMPSRAMLMTGRTLFNLYDSGYSIPSEHVMLGETLQNAGYNCWGTGKWHNGSESYARSFNDGAEIYFGGMFDHWNVPVSRYDPTGRYQSRLTRTAHYRPNNIVETKIADHVHNGTHSSELFCDAAVNFLDSYEDEDPFFMYIAFMAPHDPRSMPQEYLDMYDPAEIDIPANFMQLHPFDNGDMSVRDELLADSPRDWADVRHHIAEYYAMITHLDAQMGRVIDALRDSDRLEDTIIVFAGDNGLALGRHGLMGKQNLYDHSVHVPLILSGPGIPTGQRSSSLAYLLDIYPTLCDLTGVTAPGSVQGKSLLPAINDPTEKVRDYLYFAYKNLQRSVQDERYKLIEYAVNGERTTQLFDLANDPWETSDLSGDAEYQEQLHGLRDKLLEAKETYGDKLRIWGDFWKVY